MSFDNKRWFVIVSLVFVIILASCSATTSPTATQTPTAVPDEWENIDPQSQAIRVWHSFTGDRETAFTALVNTFNSSNDKKITVTAEFSGTESELPAKISSLAGSADAPEMAVVNLLKLADANKSDGLLDLTSLMSSQAYAFSQEDQYDIIPNVFYQEMLPYFDQARLGFPLDRWITTSIYNISWLNELGYDKMPTTYDQYKEAVCLAKTTPYSKSTGDSAVVGLAIKADAATMTAFVFNNSGDFYNSVDGKYTFSTPAAQQSLGFIQELVAEGCAQVFSNDEDMVKAFATGHALTVIDASTQRTIYQNAVNDNAGFIWSYTLIPYQISEPVVVNSGTSIVVLKSTQEKEAAAWLFIKYLTSIEAQTQWVKDTDLLPVRDGVSKNLQTYFSQQPTYKPLFSLLKIGRTEPLVPGYESIQVRMGETLKAIVEGADVTASLDALTEEANQMLADAVK